MQDRRESRGVRVQVQSPRRWRGVLVTALLVNALAAQNGPAPLPLPPTHTCRLSLTDPVAWANALLAAPEVAREVRGGSLGDLLKMTGMRNPNVAAAKAVVASIAAQVPTQITVAFPPATGTQLGQVFRLMLLTMLSSTSFELDDWEAGQAARAELRQDTLTALADLTRLSASVQLRCRDTESAEDLYDAFGEGIAALSAEFPVLQMSHRGTSMRIALVPGGNLRKSEFAELLNWTPFIVDTDDPAVDEYWRWLQQTSWGVEVEQQGDTVRMLLGEPGGDVESQLTATPPADVQTALTFAIDSRPFVAEMQKLMTLWQHWRPTELGKAFVATDQEGTIANLQMLTAAMRAAEGRSAGWIGWNDDGVHWGVDDEAVPDVDLRDHPILSLLPADPYLYRFDSATSLAMQFADLMQNAESVMDEVLEQIEDEAQYLAMQTRIAEYHRLVGPLRDTLTGEAAQLWRPPTAMVLAGNTQVQLPIGNGSVPLQLPGLALIGTRRDAAGGLPLGRRMLQLAVAAMEMPADTAVLDHDLGLGVSTVSLPAVVDGSDLVVHAFEHGDQLVFSTSLALSRRILDAAKEPARLQLSGTGRVRSTWATTGTRLGLVVARLGETTGRLTFHLDEDSHVQAGVYALVAHACAGLLQHLGTCSEVTRQTDGLMASRGSARFARAMQRDDVVDLIAAARRAAGSSGAASVARTVHGASHYVRLDGEFRFTITSDGRYDNVISSTSVERNVWRGQDGWGMTNGVPFVSAAYDRDVLTAFTAAFGNTWHDARQSMQVVAPHDVLPCDPPTVVLVGPASGHRLRLRLSPQTHLAAELDLSSDVPPGENGPFLLTDYRQVDGITLPHRLFTADGDTDYRAEGWQLHSELPAEVFADAPPPPTSEFEGSADAKVVAAANGGQLVEFTGPGGACWFHIDPGYNHPRLSHAAAKALGVAGEGKWAIAPWLRVGPMTIHDLPVMLADDDLAPRHPAKDGEIVATATIGLSVFQRCCAEFDVTEPFLRIHPPGHFDGRGADFVPAQVMPYMVTVGVQLSRDTVLPFALTFQGPMPMNLLAGPKTPGDVLTGLPIESSSKWSARWSMLAVQWPGASLGSTRLGDAMCSVPRMRLPASNSPPIAGYFGTALLRERFTLLLDLPHQRVALVPR